MLPKKNVLILYITDLSGHHKAAVAVENALRFLSPETKVHTIDSFRYTNPILERIINKTYTGVIKRTPEVWEYLYDNPKIVKNTQRLKEMIHRYNNPKMKALIDELNPDVIACTQAFPCGMVADYKTTFKSSIPLVGILTDFYPHSYWLYEAVDVYVVASEEAKVKLIENGIPNDKIYVYGIPIDIAFTRKVDREDILNRLGFDKDTYTILFMGGSAGLGPIKKAVISLDRVLANIQLIVVTGTNKKLYSYLNRQKYHFRKKIAVIGYADNINELMCVADLIITKPGGLTISEALSKALPIIIIKPIPGQEAKNTQFLLQQRVAVKMEDEEYLATLVENLCLMPSKLDSMRAAASVLGKPNAALDIAKMLLEL